MHDIKKLPKDLGSMTAVALRGALSTRRDLLAEVFEQAGRANEMSRVTALDGSSADKVAKIHELGDEVNDLAAELRDRESNVLGDGGALLGGEHGMRFGGGRNAMPALGEVGRSTHLPSGGYGSVGREWVRRMQAQQARSVDGVEMYAAIDGTSGGTMTPQFFDYRLNLLPQRGLFIRSLIPTVQVTSDKVEYLQQTVATQNAAPTAAGALKPTSLYTTQRIETIVRVIAHISEAIDRSLLMDFEQLTQFIDGQLTLGVLLAEENQILNGDGTGVNFTGILNTSGIQTQARGADPAFDAFMKAFTKLRTVFVEPNGIVMHPTDFQGLRLTRTADGLYIFGNPDESDPNMLWGKQVVQSTLIGQGTALVGDFSLGATVYEREHAFVSFTESGLGDSAGQELFSRNQIRFRAESRVGLGVPRPSAFCKVTGL